jgi:excisionase family DNA binding protein
VSENVPLLSPADVLPNAFDVQLPPIAKVSEVARYLRSSEPTIRELLRVGRIRSIRCGRSIRITRDAVDAFIRGTV